MKPTKPLLSDEEKYPIELLRELGLGFIIFGITTGYITLQSSGFFSSKILIPHLSLTFGGICLAIHYGITFGYFK